MQAIVPALAEFGADVSSFGPEDLYIGWRSGDSLTIGENALDLTVGRARYRLGHGFLLFDGAAEGGSRGGYWTNARQAFEFAAIARLQPAHHKVELFYLDKDVQKRQAIDTGWLPIRLSVLADPEVQKALPNAAVVLEQATHPYDSYVTPDYNQVTVAIGTEVNKALAGKSSAKEAMAEAANLVAAIVKKRG